MRARMLCWLMMISANLTLAQPTLDSRFGDVHTPRGDLHCLVIFIRYDNVNLIRDQRNWPDTTAPGYLPRIARGEISDLFHSDPESISLERRQNISDYYYLLSDGQFRITADIYPVQVPVAYIPERRNNFFRRQAEMNQAAINWIADNDPDFDWSKYDRRTNRPGFRTDNVDSEPDGILDYVILMHRAPGSTGMGASSNLSIPGSDLRIQDGHTGIRSYTDSKHNWLYFKHEFAHNLYACPHYLGANSADGDRFYTQKGWGLMTAWHAPFFVANAWEAWWLGWLEAQTITEPGRYQLNDYVVGRDAIRIPIPGTNDVLWLENHQKLDPWWDEKMFFKDPNQNHPQSAPGLYAYVVSPPGNDRSRPQLSPFRKSDVNFIRMLNAEGNFDWEFPRDSFPTGYFQAPVLRKVAPNPIAGQNAFQFIRADYNGDGRLAIGYSHGNSDAGGMEQHDIWVEREDGTDRLTLAGTGDANDAFGVGDEIGLSGIVPVTNYPRFYPKQDSLAPYQLSGVTVRVVGQSPAGSLELDLQFQDWEVRRDQRWCGRIVLPPQDSLQLRVADGTTLDLALSGTPMQARYDSLTGFAPPTELRIGEGQTLALGRRATLRIGAHSRLVLAAQAQLQLAAGARIEVLSGGEIRLGDEVLVSVSPFGRIRLAEGGAATLGEGVVLDKSWLGRVDW